MAGKSQITLYTRLQACLLYGWIFPAYWCSKRQDEPFLRHHYRQSLLMLLFFLLLLLLDALLFLFLTTLIIQYQDVYSSMQWHGYLGGFIRKLWLCGGVFWCYGVVTALFASQRPMPLVRKLGDRKRLRHTAIAGWGIVLGTVLLLLPFVLHAAWITPAPSGNGKAWFLYDDLDRLPRTLFSAGFYPMTRAAQERWGENEVVLVKLTEESLRQALERAEFLFIASHGSDEGLVIDNYIMAPEHFSTTKANAALRYVYMAGCDAGALEAEWKALFAPAEVVLFDRISATLEHVWWMWFQGPEVIRGV